MIAWRAIRPSLAFTNKDRITILLYGVKPVVISLGIEDSVHYKLSFDNSTRIYVPGGYGVYSIGGLSKLAQLEQDHDLLQRTFSSMISTHVDYYFYPKNVKIYNTDYTQDFSPTKRAILSAIFSPSVKSNVRFMDKAYLFFMILQKRKIDFIELKTNFYETNNDDVFFSSRAFFKAYQGFFYKKRVRMDDKTIQIVYNANGMGAAHLSRVLEGEGMRVVDIMKSDSVIKKCKVVYDISTQEILYTVRILAGRFGCQIQMDNLDGSDIQFFIDDHMTKIWE